MFGNDVGQTVSKMMVARPSMVKEWSTILHENKDLYDKIGFELCHNMIHETKNKNKTERNDI
jgi:hypothetical protein